MEIQFQLSQEDAAVLNAIRQVREGTGFGRVVVDVQKGRIKTIEISYSVRITRNNDKIDSEDAHEA